MSGLTTPWQFSQMGISSENIFSAKTKKSLLKAELIIFQKKKKCYPLTFHPVLFVYFRTIKTMGSVKGTVSLD